MSNRIQKAVIPAAGLGTRFLPITKAVPKEMIPIIDQPMIEPIVQEVLDSGINQIILVTARNKTAIEDYFDYRPELEDHLISSGKVELANKLKKIADSVELIFVRQKNPKGLGHAVWTTKSVVGDHDFAVLLGDDLIIGNPPCTKQLSDIYASTGKSVVGVMNVAKDQVSKYGSVQTGKELDSKTWEVLGMVEKPSPSDAPSTLAVPGRYVLPAEIFKIIENTPAGKGGEVQLTDALSVLAKEKKLLAHEFAGQRFDTGDKVGYIDATLFFALQRPDLKDEIQGLLKKYVQK